ncbi:MAG TPA: efflux RND transporter periplasmic adaptor subunit [Anaeromyxobacteraceae bacterium]|nr:efflux RND transporter periplasmic adaptor subunit [Anaeromyxobacteraceae bacterium]
MRHALRMMFASLAFFIGTSACRPAGGGVAASQAVPATLQAALRLATPEHVRHEPEVIATGTLRPRWQAQLGFAVSGTLERILVKRGQAVLEGAPLLRLDGAAARAQLAQAEAAVNGANAQLAQAKDGLARIEAIYKQGGVADAEMVQGRLRRNSARAQLIAAEAQREQARVNVGDHELRAPFAGVVTKIPDGTGLSVSAGVPLVVLESMRQLVLETSLTQEEATTIRPGIRAEVSVGATGARTLDATVAVVVPSVDTETSRVPVEISVPNANGRFLPHAFARARLPAGEMRDALRVPAAAVIQREGSFALWIIGADKRARSVPVRVLAQEAEHAIVDVGAADLPAAVHVIAMPPLGLVEGQALAQGGEESRR